MDYQTTEYLLPLNQAADLFYEGYSDYLMSIQQTIALYHTHQPQFSQATIIEANSPFDWPNQGGENGVVLVHGLTDSAFQMRDIGHFFKQQGFWVRGLTLPGHGIRPGALLHIKLKAWRQAVAHAVNDLARQVKNVYLCGYSTGAALAIDLAIDTANIHGLILFAPALRLKRYIELAIRAQALFKVIWRRAQWLDTAPELDYAKYASLPVNAALQLQLLINELSVKIPKSALATPIFQVLTDTDELIDNEQVMSLTKHFTHPDNQLLIYSKYPAESQPDKIYRPSYYPEQNIVDFSHIALATSPANIHCGEQGDLLPFLASHGNIQSPIIHRGAMCHENKKQYHLQRLTYNPDFAEMCKLLNDWLSKIKK